MTEPAAAQAHDLARRCVEAMYAADAASRALGMRIVDVAPGRATVRMTVTDQMLNGHGIGHGGYTFMLADSAFAFACNSYDVATVAAACDIVFMAPTRAGDVLEAVAIERQRFGRRGIYDVTVSRVANAAATGNAISDGVATVVAEFRGVSQSTRDPVLPKEGE